MKKDANTMSSAPAARRPCLAAAAIVVAVSVIAILSSALLLPAFQPMSTITTAREGGFAAYAQPSSSSSPPSSSSAATTANGSSNDSTAMYGCGIVGSAVHCDPILNKFQSFEVEGSTKKLYTMTRANEEIPFVSGVSGQALEFHAYFGEFLEIPNAPEMNPPQFSVSFWAKKDSEFRNYGHVLSHVDRTFSKGWTFDNGNATDQSIRFAVFNANGTAFSPDDIALDSTAFVHVVGVFDGSTVKVYRNGQLNGQPVQFTGQYIADPEVPIKVAMAAPRFSNPWEGMIDEVRLYNRTLSDVEIRDIFASSSSPSSSSHNSSGLNGTAPPPSTAMSNVTAAEAGQNAFSSPSPPSPSSLSPLPISSGITGDGLAGYWPFDGDVSDASGNGNHGIYTIQTVGMAFTPDGKKMFFTEKNTGKIRIMQNDTVLDSPFATVPNMHYDMEQGLLGIAVDPDYEQNRFVYAYYTANNLTAADAAGASSTSENSSAITTGEGDHMFEPFNRVVRYTDADGSGTNMTVIIDGIPAHMGGMHAGGAIAFGKHDGKLYIAVGNAYEEEAALDVTSLLGKVLRINKDGTIPEDNPFPGSPVYTIGHRNMYGLAFDGRGGGIVTENGEDLYDEINMLVKGGNYGFPTAQPPDRPPELATDPATIKPIRSYWKTIAPTQAIFYDGSKHPALQGMYIVGSYNNGRLYALEVSNGTTTTANDTASSSLQQQGQEQQQEQLLQREMKIEFPYLDASNIIAVAQSPSGDIYYGGYYIYKLQSVDVSDREQIMAPIEISYSHEPQAPSPPAGVETKVMVKDVKLDPAAKSVSITMSAERVSRQQTLIPLPSTAPPNATVNIAVKIPKIALDGISNVTAIVMQGFQQLPQPVEFAIDGQRQGFQQLPQQPTPEQQQEQQQTPPLPGSNSTAAAAADAAVTTVTATTALPISEGGGSSEGGHDVQIVIAGTAASFGAE